MPDIKAIIYDLDGVLVNSRRANLLYYNRLLAHFGLPPVQPHHLELIQTRTSAEVIARLFPDPELGRAAQELEKQLDNDDIIPLIEVEPYVPETLAALRKTHRTAIATNRGKSLPLVLEFHNLGGYFDVTVSSSQVKHPKPHPDYLTIILREFSLAPGQVIFIGDAEVDAQLAGAVGVPFLAYKNASLPARRHLWDHREIWGVLEPCPEHCRR